MEEAEEDLVIVRRNICRKGECVCKGGGERIEGLTNDGVWIGRMGKIGCFVISEMRLLLEKKAVVYLKLLMSSPPSCFLVWISGKRGTCLCPLFSAFKLGIWG